MGLAKLPLLVEAVWQQIKRPFLHDSKSGTISEVIADHRGTEAALCRAVREAVLQTAKAGLPIAAWENGAVVWIAPDEALRRLREQSQPNDRQ